ncbi:hypothetical protein M409DRAFT_71642 [Zasmidium cellare ATCC 36951]|uniref:Major facilitator superfamily (MFS) profile domain-containing protein n=1 Tax=Zasmidium cellare ATCC 36951 TaxID=1080233 RepID=A0A6A6BY25_ZASCE|nr:uncharacterized protein M409DRAFT_71642 [Zasmidium cellare ATCC 36951]KAF2158439.1 hypothetical protein M409DRAFT_71642 [Zasmidium cellare ATCC 36951]
MLQETTRYLEGKQLILAVLALNAANGVCFVDLLGITAVLPTIAESYNAAGTIAWAGTSQLVGATIGQCLLGYLSDLFSRRRMLQYATLILTISSLLCALSGYPKDAPFLYTVRAFSGIATGSISNLVNIAQNDFLPVHRRGKYQGIQGISVALGSILGVMAGAAFSLSGNAWNVMYYMETGMAAVAFALIYLFVPPNIVAPRWEQVNETLKSFDGFGMLSGAGFIVPLLILVCQASSLKKQEAVLIALSVLCAVSLTVFMTLGFRDRKVRPVIPFALFCNRTIAAILAQNVLFGAVYYGFIYFVPLYLQVVREKQPVLASAIFVPYFATHGIWSTVSGLILSMLQNKGRRSYSYVLSFGFAIWTLAMGLLAWHSNRVASPLALFVVFEILVGLGTGSVFQNSIMAIRAQVTADLNAVAVSTRNVLRFFGGALGIAICSTVLENRLKYSMPWRLEWVSDTAFSRTPKDMLSPSDYLLVQHSYARAIAWIWYIATGMIALSLVLCLLIKDKTCPAIKPGNHVSEEQPAVRP